MKRIRNEVVEKTRPTTAKKKNPKNPESAIADLATALHVLAHPVRLEMLRMLVSPCDDGQLCVCDLEEALPVGQATVSHHLRLLSSAGLVETNRRGLWTYCIANKEAIRSLLDRTAALLEV